MKKYNKNKNKNKLNAIKTFIYKTKFKIFDYI